MNSNCKLSRRSALKSVALLAGTACAGLLSYREAVAQGKVPQAAMKYQDHPNGEQKCSNCMQFIAPDTCKVVEGKVSPNGYCIAWVKKS